MRLVAACGTGGGAAASILRPWTGTTASGLGTWALPFELGPAVLEGALDPAGSVLVLAAPLAVGVRAAVLNRSVSAPSRPPRSP